MIKRTLYFGNPAYLHLENKQLVVKLPEVEKNQDLSLVFKKESTAKIPIEDIGMKRSFSEKLMFYWYFTALLGINSTRK